MHLRRFLGVTVMVAGAAACVGEGPVRPAIDVLLSDSLHLVRDVRVGILTNQTGVDANGVDDITRLRDAGVRLTAIFSPEHGFRGALDEENIGHGVDSATGLRVYSLYGAVRAPTAAMLDSVDVLLVDLQDIGARPYTFVSTALRALAATTTGGVRMIVLDRPNPIGGALVQGPVLEPPYASFVGMLPVALRHGMTMGELLRFGKDALGLGGELEVVPVSGWRRALWFDDTELPWVRPSPSMPDLESATHYPGLVLFEATNLSVGRGTPIAFQVVGAPWLDAAGLAAALGDVPGVAVGDTAIRPVEPPDGKYAGETIPAVRFRVTDRERYDPTALAVHAMVWIDTRHPRDLEVDAGRLDQRAGTDGLRRQLDAGVAAAAIVAGWREALEAFRVRRAGYLLY